MVTFETRGGAECLHTGSNFSAITRQKDLKSPKYYLMQMLPASPFRLEWVRDNNIREKVQR